ADRVRKRSALGNFKGRGSLNDAAGSLRRLVRAPRAPTAIRATGGKVWSIRMRGRGTGTEERFEQKSAADAGDDPHTNIVAAGHARPGRRCVFQPIGEYSCGGGDFWIGAVRGRFVERFGARQISLHTSSLFIKHTEADLRMRLALLRG